MSNEFKLVPVEPTVVMEDAGAPECIGYCARCDDELQIKTGMQVDIYRAMLAAAPQPPALGGEPEVLGYLWQHRKGAKYGTYVDVNPLTGRQEECDDFSKTELIDRAHIAPLQAELNNITRQFDGLAAAVGFTKERCEQAGDSPIDCAEQLAALSVTNIMLDVVPGDGSGHEVYARSVSDVEAALTGLSDKLEAAEGERDQVKARCDELEGLLRECRPALDQAAGGVFKEHRVIRDKVKAAMSKPAGSEPRHQISDAGMKLIDEAINKDGMPS